MVHRDSPPGLQARSNQDPESVYVTDSEGRIVDVNPHACRELGFSYVELLGMRISDVDAGHPLTLGSEMRKLAAHDKSKAQRRIHRRRDGNTFSVEVQVKTMELDKVEFLCTRARTLPQTDSTSNPAEPRALDLGLFREIFESSREAIAIIDHEGHYLLQNAAHRELLGYEDEDLVDRTPAIHLGPEGFESVGRNLAQSGRHLGEHDSRTKSGGTRRVEISAFTVGGHDGNPPLFVAINRAVSDVQLRRTESAELERQEALESLKRSQKMEVSGQLAAGVAHDFNNLLTPIMGFADLELIRQEDGSTSAKAMQVILESARRGRALTSQLLAFARKQVMSMELTCLAREIESGQGLLQQLIPCNGSIRLRLDLGKGVSPVLADAGQIHHVLMNLVVNARDAMMDGGEILVRLRNTEIRKNDPLISVLGSPGTYVNLSVSDQGCGMDADTQERAFEPFFSTKSENGGTGLGLSIAHGIVSQHNGHIHSVSEVGRGTTFQIYLPPACLNEVLDAESTTLSSDSAAGQKTILMVENEVPVRTVVIRILSELGYRVLPAANGPEALEFSTQEDLPIHLLLTDVMMPGMNGPQLCAKVRERHPGLPVLYMSAFARDELAEDGFLGEDISMIEKPFTSDELVQKIRAAFHSE